MNNRRGQGRNRRDARVGHAVARLEGELLEPVPFVIQRDQEDNPDIQSVDYVLECSGVGDADRRRRIREALGVLTLMHFEFHDKESMVNVAKRFCSSTYPEDARIIIAEHEIKMVGCAIDWINHQISLNSVINNENIREKLSPEILMNFYRQSKAQSKSNDASIGNIVKEPKDFNPQRWPQWYKLFCNYLKTLKSSVPMVSLYYVIREKDYTPETFPANMNASDKMLYSIPRILNSREFMNDSSSIYKILKGYLVSTPAWPRMI